MNFKLFSSKEPDIPKDKLPRHIAFIMDGNGRWAKRRGLVRSMGHVEGAKAFKQIVSDCYDIGIETVTVYAFSTENWKRPKDEVDAIMGLLDKYIEEVENYSEEKKARIIFLGGREPFNEERRAKLDYVEEKTAPESAHTLNIALNYGARDELCRAVNSLVSEGKSDVTEQDISERLFTKLSSDPDLIIRTGGEQRLSNFLLWQAAYAELYFTDTLWPDFGKKELLKILAKYAGIHRRFGGL